MKAQTHLENECTTVTVVVLSTNILKHRVKIRQTLTNIISYTHKLHFSRVKATLVTQQYESFSRQAYHFEIAFPPCKEISLVFLDCLRLQVLRNVLEKCKRKNVLNNNTNPICIVLVIETLISMCLNDSFK